MTREEAIKIVRNIYQTDTEKEALATLIPELAESEDERMIEELQGFLESYGADYFGTDEWQQFDDWLEKQKERKPDIELIQRSWYMEGYHDREFGKEPKWILKTGEGGPKHELNPRYGQSLAKQQPTEEQMHNLNEAIKGFRMDGCERIADSLHSLYIFLKSLKNRGNFPKSNIDSPKTLT